MYITLLHILYEVPGHNKYRISSNKYSTNRLGIHNKVTSIIFYISSVLIYRGCESFTTHLYSVHDGMPQNDTILYNFNFIVSIDSNNNDI